MVEEQRLRGITEVRVSKEELLIKLRENRQKHEQEYTEAISGYKMALVESLQIALDYAKTNGEFKLQHLPIPENHTSEYDRIISMLEMSKDDELELSQQEFAQYALDDWKWKAQFAATAQSYSGRN